MEMNDFVAGIGRTNIDLIYHGLPHLPKLGEEVFSEGFEIHMGGGAPGESVILSRLGIPVKVFTWLGNGFFAKLALSEFIIGNPSVIDLYKGNGNPLVISSTMVYGNDRTFLSYCENIELSGSDIEIIREEFMKAKIILLSPHFPELFKDMDLSGKIHVFDTGWEEDLSLDNPRYRQLIGMADYYLPNRREALKITGKSSIDEAADVLSTHFSEVIIKLDADGCLIRDNNGTRIIPPMKNTTAVDSTGAGDAFLSGFVYGLYHGHRIEECVQFGNITGGTCVQAYGCLTKTLTEPELLEKHREMYC